MFWIFWTIFSCLSIQCNISSTFIYVFFDFDLWDCCDSDSFVIVKLISLLWSVNLKKTEVFHHLLLNPYIMYPPLICVSMKHGAYITHNAPHPLNDITGGRLSDNMQWKGFILPFPHTVVLLRTWKQIWWNYPF